MDVIILDDAFQHRFVNPGLSILLTDFHKLYSVDYPLPSGNLREFRSGAHRADIVIVTKSSNVLSPITQRSVEESLKLGANQKLYFSYIEHGELTSLPNMDFKPVDSRYSAILLVTGIANSYPLEVYLKKYSDRIEKISFPDHHQYTPKDIDKLAETFDNLFSQNKIIVTTEKDAMRLMAPHLSNKLKKLPLCYVPIEIIIHKEGRKEFNEKIINYVKENRRNSKIRK